MLPSPFLNSIIPLYEPGITDVPVHIFRRWSSAARLPGAVIQQGTHAGLVADENGKNHELWNAQAQYYTEKTA